MKSAHYQVAAWSAFALIVFVTVSPIQMRPGGIFTVDVDRGLAFGLLASMFMIAYPRQAIVVGLLVVITAGMTEALQLLSPSRHARIDDALIKSSGAVAGMVIASFYNALRVARHGRRTHARSPIRRLKIASIDAGMTSLPVKSKLIDSIYFSPEDGKLRIRMHNGEERLFEGVSQGEAEALATAQSPGRHYVNEIKPKFRRVA